MARFRIISAFLLCSILSFGQKFPDKPSHAVYVTDNANLFSANEKRLIESELIDYFDSTSTQIIIYTTASLEGNDVADYTIKLANHWGAGDKSKDNGVLWLIAPNERKQFIATGYGTQIKLTDGFLSDLQHLYVKPEFKNGNYFGGVQLGISMMISQLNGEFQKGAKDTNLGQEEVVELTTTEIIMIVLFFLIFLWIISKAAKGSNYGETYSGRGYNGGLGGGFWGGESSGGWSSGGSGGFSGGSFGGGSFGGGGSGSSW
jgi:uncharacterized protein